MKRFLERHKKLVIFICVMIVLYLLRPLYEFRDYGVLLDTDTLNIYSGKELIATVPEPVSILDLYNGGVAVGVVGDLGISKWGMKELYRLEFLQDGKKIRTIKIMTPKGQKQIDKVREKGAPGWKTMNGTFVVLSENGHYFHLGKWLYTNLKPYIYK